MISKDLQNFYALLEEMRRWPAVSNKNASRLCLNLLNKSETEVDRFCNLVLKARELIKKCNDCCSMTEWNICQICSDEKRDHSVICVVATQSELFAIRDVATEYNGLFHVLGGLISPLEGITPADLNIETLLARLKKNDIKEVIFAFSPTPEGEVTISYIQKLMGHLEGVELFKIASGISVGANLEFTDRSTLLQAFTEKRLLQS